MKVPIRHRVNAKHNFTTTQEMKELEWYGGIRGYGAAVVKFDTPKEVSKDGKSAFWLFSLDKIVVPSTALLLPASKNNI